jgi:hypothetical protein
MGVNLLENIHSDLYQFNRRGQSPAGNITKVVQGEISSHERA